MITAEHLARVPLFAALPPHELNVIAEHAADLALQPGDWLISEGEVPAYFGVLEGRLEVLKGVGSESRAIAAYGVGDTFGEVPLLLDSAAVASVRALEPSRVFRLDPPDFRALVLDCAALRGEVLGAMSRRLGDLQRLGAEAARAEITIVGRRWDLECHDVRDFLSRNRVAFFWLDPDDEDARHRIPVDARDAATYPIVLLPDGRRLIAPDQRALAAAIGLQTEPHGAEYDLAIVGAGPAGLAAAVYGASEGLRTILVEREAPGGQAGTSSRIENYLGFPTGLSGDELAKRAYRQAGRFGAEIVIARTVDAIEPAGDPGVSHTLVLNGGTRVRARAIVLATGVRWRTLDVPGVAELGGRGVYYGAARTEALGTRGKRVVLVGGGNSAGQAAMHFSSYAASVTLLVRGASLGATMSQYLVDELASKANVEVKLRSEVVAALGDDHLTALDVRDASGAAQRVPADALFIFIGAVAETAWLPPAIIRDRGGYLCTGRDVVDLVRGGGGHWPLERDPYLLETSVPGIFAAGDVRHNSIKRVASSVGEGSMSVAFVHQFLLDPLAAQPA